MTTGSWSLLPVRKVRTIENELRWCCCWTLRGVGISHKTSKRPFWSKHCDSWGLGVNWKCLCYWLVERAWKKRKCRYRLRRCWKRSWSHWYRGGAAWCCQTCGQLHPAVNFGAQGLISTEPWHQSDGPRALAHRPLQERICHNHDHNNHNQNINSIKPPKHQPTPQQNACKVHYTAF